MLGKKESNESSRKPERDETISEDSIADLRREPNKTNNQITYNCTKEGRKEEGQELVRNVCVKMEWMHDI